MYRITKTFGFSASHVLDGLPEGHPCGRWHGHNYKVELILGAESLDQVGFVVDYRALDMFRSFLETVFDHWHLNDVVDFNPTAENLAAYLHGVASDMFGSRRVAAVRVSETDSTWAEYWGPSSVAS